MASNRMSRAVSTSWATFVFLASTSGAHAAAAPADSLKTLSVEELMNIEVTSVSRRPEKLLEAPSAIQVITGDEIRRSGAPNIPSALRLASNLSVAQENAHEWVISARGFSSDVGNKLLVMMDGRTVYTPLFSGVFWDRQDYVLADIDRIEVISGPGGTLWGANAVNGVININTKSSQDTQGLHLEAGGGSDPKQFGALRYGGKLAEDVSFRVYGKYSDYRSEELTNRADARDDWHMGQGGFRLDTTPSATNHFTLQGDYYDAREGIPTGGDSTVTGMNVLGRWSRRFSDESDLSLQLYYDRTDLALPVPAGAFYPAGTFLDDLDTYDLDFQHRFALGERHRLVWGFGFRFTHDEVTNAPGLGFFPTELDQRLYSGFLQDEIRLSSNVVFTLGTKIEHTDYTGYEFEPNVRLQWTLSPEQTLWGSVSRAVRTPSRIDREISLPSPGYLIVTLQGGRNFESENLLAYELGYRSQLNQKLSFVLSSFYNDYDDLRSTTVGPPNPAMLNLPFPFFFENNLEGETYGFELTADYQLLDRWRLKLGYNLLQEDLRIKQGKGDFNNALNETADPQQQVSLRSSFDLPLDLELDAGLRWIDIRTINNAGVPTTVPDYCEMDVRLGWRPHDRLQLSVVGQNLLNDRHPEYGQPGPGRVQIERSVYGKFVWSF